jgi:hypothetical protein
MRKESRTDSAIRTGRELLKVPRIYSDAKQEIVEQTITTAESWESRLVAIPFIIGMILFWAFTIWSGIGFEVIFETFSTVLVGAFAFAYFFFFHVSKLVYKTTDEEVSDDTSMFALFSANRRKERRSFISIFLAVLHTLAVVGYMIHNDTGWLNIE